MERGTDMPIVLMFLVIFAVIGFFLFVGFTSAIIEGHDIIACPECSSVLMILSMFIGGAFLVFIGGMFQEIEWNGFKMEYLGGVILGVLGAFIFLYAAWWLYPGGAYGSGWGIELFPNR